MSRLRFFRELGGAVLAMGLVAAGSARATDPINNYQPSTAITYTVGAGNHNVGVIGMYAGSFGDPSSETLANGASKGSASYPGLANVLGTTYGGGGGSFNLPNLSGAVPIGTGSGSGLTSRTLGEVAGSAEVTFATANLPASLGGSSQPFTIMEPSLAMSYYVATEGIYPQHGGTANSSAGTIQYPFVGQIFLTATGSAPHTSGYASADGLTLDISSDTELFSLLSDSYGGNGTSTFALPDLRGRAAMGAGGTSWMGEKRGAETVTLSTANLPPPDGSGQSFSNLQPSLTINYLICSNGLFPGDGDSGMMGNTSVYVGQIITVGFDFAPPGWYGCFGQTLPISGNEELFAVIGTAYGGDGMTNFALPDFRDKVPIGYSGSLPVGTEIGADSTTLTVSQVVPEPSTVALVAIALLLSGISAIRRRQRR